MATYIIGTLIFLAFCYAIYRTFFSKGKSCCGGLLRLLPVKGSLL